MEAKVTSTIGIRKMNLPETENEMLIRLELMAINEFEDWDFSENDTNMLIWAFEKIKKLSEVGVQPEVSLLNQQLFNIAEIENFLLRQKEICKQEYNRYCTDRELPISGVCRQMIVEAPMPNIVKS